MSQPIVEGERPHYEPTGARERLEMDQKLRFEIKNVERSSLSETNNYISAKVIALRVGKTQLGPDLILGLGRRVGKICVGDGVCICICKRSKKL